MQIQVMQFTIRQYQTDNCYTSTILRNLNYEFLQGTRNQKGQILKRKTVKQPSSIGLCICTASGPIKRILYRYETKYSH